MNRTEPTTPVQACIALGSNLGDRQGHIEAAFAGLAALPSGRLLRRSTVIETDPVGPAGQSSYLNAAAVIETVLEPRTLLDRLLAIEAARGRVRPDSVRWGPRTLDLDLLLFCDRTIDEPGLTVPHPRLSERLFVLRPLAEIAGEFIVPGTGRTVRALLEAINPSAR